MAAVDTAARARGLTGATLRLLRQYSFGFALLLMLVLLITNLARTPNFGWTDQLANFAPLAVAAMASTPPSSAAAAASTSRSRRS